jgi:hypothetical protein
MQRITKILQELIGIFIQVFYKSLVVNAKNTRKFIKF